MNAPQHRDLHDLAASIDDKDAEISEPREGGVPLEVWTSILLVAGSALNALWIAIRG